MVGLNLGNQLYFITPWITYLKLPDEPFVTLDELQLGLVSDEALAHDSHTAMLHD
jgi:hypothetical protein